MAEGGGAPSRRAGGCGARRRGEGPLRSRQPRLGHDAEGRARLRPPPGAVPLVALAPAPLRAGRRLPGTAPPPDALRPHARRSRHAVVAPSRGAAPRGAVVAVRGEERGGSRRACSAAAAAKGPLALLSHHPLASGGAHGDRRDRLEGPPLPAPRRRSLRSGSRSRASGRSGSRTATRRERARTSPPDATDGSGPTSLPPSTGIPPSSRPPGTTTPSRSSRRRSRPRGGSSSRVPASGRGGESSRSCRRHASRHRGRVSCGSVSTGAVRLVSRSSRRPPTEQLRERFAVDLR